MKTNNSPSGVSSRIRLHIALLLIGVAGLVCLLLVKYFFMAPPKTVVSSYASRGAISNLGEILLLPAAIFFGILIAYPVNELFKSYRLMNDPETYRNKTYRKRGATRGARRQQIAGQQTDERTMLLSSTRPRQYPSKRQSKAGRSRRTPLH